MKQYPTYECKSLDEVKEATKNLDVASLVPIKIIDGGVSKDVENFRAVYNNSVGRMCAAVVPYYNLIQHRQYFNSFAEAMDRLNIKYVMTIQQIGNRAFADIEFTGKNIKFTKLNEEFTTGLRLINSYDKTTGLFVIPRFTRLACTNGMIITRSEKTVSIKHHERIIKELEAFIEKRLNQLVTQYDDLQGWVSECMKDSIEWRVCCKIIEKMFNQMKHREEILKLIGINLITEKDKTSKKVTISYVWQDDKNKKDKITRWALYNAITQYLTHGEHITPHIENLFHKRAEKLLVTPLAKMPRVEGL